MSHVLRAATVVAAVGAAFLPSPASAESASCAIYADNPYKSAYGIEADGGRVGCVSPAQIRVRIREDLSLAPDRTLAERTVTAVDANVHVHFPCDPFGWQLRRVFTETIVGESKVKSARISIYCT